MRLAAALSGGADSTFAAILLKEAGHEILGFHLRLFSPAPEPGPLFQLARNLGIPLEIIDLSSRFQEVIVSPFVRDYLSGRTPNPCVGCNPLIKFGALWEVLKPYQADALVSGHYARIDQDFGSGGWKLKRGKDPSKDQSYYLHRLSQAQLGRTLLPLGDWDKARVRRELKERGITVPYPQESQEVCFIGKEGYRAFLERAAGKDLPPEGEIVDLEGRVMGRHQGIHRYTIGQRQGMGVPGPEPYYVLALDREENRVVMGPKKALFKDHFLTREFHWTLPGPPEGVLRARVQLRYRHFGCMGLLKWDQPGKVEIFLEEPQFAVTPGQSAVAYLEEEVVGGGIIC